MVRSWYMNNNEEDQRLEHHIDPPSFVEIDKLRELGVLHWTFKPENYKQDLRFNQLKEDRGYTYEDLIVCSPDTLENYESKIKSFYNEHIHTDEEIRFVLDGSGFFDVRDFDDRWIRIQVTKGDLIVLPAGIFHRFTLDANDYIKALRLFVGEPVWTPLSRSELTEDHPSIRNYRKNFHVEIVAT